MEPAKFSESDVLAARDAVQVRSREQMDAYVAEYVSARDDDPRSASEIRAEARAALARGRAVLATHRLERIVAGLAAPALQPGDVLDYYYDSHVAGTSRLYVVYRLTPRCTGGPDA